MLWRKLYPAVDVMQELRKMKGWLLSNPKKRKTKRGIKRFVNGWLAREQDRGRSITPNCNAAYQSRIEELEKEQLPPSGGENRLEVRY